MNAAMTRSGWMVLTGVLATALGMGCGSSSGGGSTSTGGGGGGFTITIQNMAFSPTQLAVPPGATVTVTNMDGSIPHSVTSEAKDNDFTPGAAGGVQFDTGSFTGTKTFTIPANAAAGTVIPYYCVVHKGSMATPNGSIKIDAAATGSGGTSGTSGTSGTVMGTGGY